MRPVFAVFAFVLLGSGLAVRPAVAATASASFGVSVTVQGSCRASAIAAAFRTYSAAANATSPVSVTCSNSTPYNVTLSAAMPSGATGPIREATGSGAAFLAYALSSAPRGIVNWGQAVHAGTVPGSGPGSGSGQMFPVHGQIAAGQYVAASAYPDTTIVTVTY
ncbi:MAG: spore coat protein U domain-containing protein [Terracidiphilus sp.]|nr:spore coat protein U domain-containing protein [Terracidiphilus sp.]